MFKDRIYSIVTILIYFKCFYVTTINKAVFIQLKNILLYQDLSFLFNGEIITMFNVIEIPFRFSSCCHIFHIDMR